MNIIKSNQIFYAEDYRFGYYQGPKGLLTKEEAKQRHAKGIHYVAIIGCSIDKLDYVVYIHGEVNFFGVEFIDKWNRGYLTHQFQKYPDSERYYLSMAVWREYMSLDSHEIAEGTTYFFNAENDECYVLKEDLTTNQRYEKTEYYPQKDKIILFPEFGKYDDILNPNII